VRDYYNEREFGEVSGVGTLHLAFTDFLVLEVVPV
jgi:hypothetical protein